MESTINDIITLSNTIGMQVTSISNIRQSRFRKAALIALDWKHLEHEAISYDSDSFESSDVYWNVFNGYVRFVRLYNDSANLEIADYGGWSV